MLGFSILQWALLFYLYCFIGWVWECCYVSIDTRKLTNRGFLHGPLLPIYGSGALIILLSTLKVTDSIPLTFLIGMVAASTLEYITGVTMEAIFKVRYWDYSDKFLNVNGHICAYASIGWGFGSVILVNWANTPFANAILSVPSSILETLVMGITIATSIDIAVSVREALDLRELLEKIAKNNLEVQKIQAKLDEAATIISTDAMAFKLKADENRASLKAKLENENGRLEAIKRELAAKEAAITNIPKRFKATIVKTNALREQKLNDMISDLEFTIAELDKKLVDEVENVSMENMKSELKTIKNSISLQKMYIGFSNKAYASARMILERNPEAIAPGYADALKQIIGEKEKDGD